MVEHAWVRIAEIKADAAAEEWAAAHPRLFALKRRARLQRIRWLNRLKDFRESEHGQTLEKRLQTFLASRATEALYMYLAITRCGGCRPSRKHVCHLSARQLIGECKLRSIHIEDCIERRELLDALCGEDEAANTEHTDERDGLIAPLEIDKMV